MKNFFHIAKSIAVNVSGRTYGVIMHLLILIPNLFGSKLGTWMKSHKLL